MAKKKLRNIVVDGKTYYWSFRPGYQRTDDPANPFCCHDLFTVYAETNHTSPLRITFVTEDDAIIGGSLRTGAPIASGDSNTRKINLNTPKWAVILLREGLKRGWQPNAHSVSFTIENGVELLTQLNHGTV